MAAEAQDTATRVQSQLQAMQESVERWQGQYEGLRGQDLGQAVLDAGRSGAPMALAVPLMEAGRVGGKGLRSPSLQCLPWRRRCPSCWPS